MSISFRHDVFSLLLAPYVEAPTMYVVDWGDKGLQQMKKTQPKASNNPMQVLFYPRDVWYGNSPLILL